MKKVNAIWEKRNLGVSCVEITIEAHDSCQEIEHELTNLGDIEYVVVKVSAPNVEAQYLLAKYGYTFIEANINMFLDIRNLKLSPIEERINAKIGYREIVSKQQQNQFEDEIRKGIFQTDRILLDPHFSADVAANRYINWMRDELSNGCNLYEIVYSDTPIGFFIQKQLDEKTFYPFLAGLYKGNEGKVGLGISTLTKPIEDAKMKGGRYISTYVSSNNLPIVKIHTQIGFVPNKIYNVLVKHNKLETK